MEEYFCGIGKVPKGKERGTMEQCLQQGQVRYYGLVKIDPKVIENNNKKKKIKNLQEEEFKLKNLETKAKKLVRDIKFQRIILNNNESPEKKKKAATRELKILFKQRDNLIKNLKNQSKKVKDMQKIKEMEKQKILVIPKGKNYWNEFIKKHSAFIKDLDMMMKPKKVVKKKVVQKKKPIKLPIKVMKKKPIPKKS